MAVWNGECLAQTPGETCGLPNPPLDAPRLCHEVAGTLASPPPPPPPELISYLAQLLYPNFPSTFPRIYMKGILPTKNKLDPRKF